MMILKIGGGAEIDLDAVAADPAVREERTVAVIGANSVRDGLAARLGVEVKRVTSLKGYTSVFTDDDAVDLLMMAYAGLRAKRFVERLQRRAVDAVGLSGLDGALIRGRRNKGIRTRRGDKKVLLHDLSGKPASVNDELLRYLLDRGYTPVITVPILDEKGLAVNTENDEIVALLHKALRAERVVHLIEAEGLLADPADPSSRVSSLDARDLEAWEEKASGRMKRKLLSLRKLFDHGSPEVRIGDGRVELPVTRVLSGEGTVIR